MDLLWGSCVSCCVPASSVCLPFLEPALGSWPQGLCTCLIFHLGCLSFFIWVLPTCSSGVSSRLLRRGALSGFRALFQVLAGPRPLASTSQMLDVLLCVPVRDHVSRRTLFHKDRGWSAFAHRGLPGVCRGTGQSECSRGPYHLRPCRRGGVELERGLPQQTSP